MVVDDPLTAPSHFFETREVKVIPQAHHLDITDLAWSRVLCYHFVVTFQDGLLLSASLDCTVRLWYPDHNADYSKCICDFTHPNAVVGVACPQQANLFPVTVAYACRRSSPASAGTRQAC